MLCVQFASGYTAADIEAEIGLDRWDDALSKQSDHVLAVVRRYDGMLDVRHGSHILIGAGAAAADDHAERACLAAWDMQQQANRLAAEIGSSGGIDLRLRIALSSGPVSVGYVGSGQGAERWPAEYTAHGKPMDTAWDLALSIPRGAVMLSESTARRVVATAVLAEPEMVHLVESSQLFGPNPTVPAWRLLGVRPAHPRTDV